MTERSLDSAVLESPVETADALDLDDVRRCTELLQKIVADRGILAAVPLEMRQALLIAAGQASRPQSFQEKRLVKTLRRVRRLGEEAKDRESRAVTGIRQAREATVFVAPALLGDAATAPLAGYRAAEMERMRLNFYGFDASYHVARHHFVHKLPRSRTPLHLARHRRSAGGAPASRS